MSKLQQLKASLAKPISEGNSDAGIEATLQALLKFTKQQPNDTVQIPMAPSQVSTLLRRILEEHHVMRFFVTNPDLLILYPPEDP